ncbi:TolC family protein [Novosphingobium sp.]|uniref:TolC family protein n=1 Tax=Novosphingobium sp. TaxID=1874826 RepID=UPI0026053091|nr:TolC family protein [Novosphingobium sp.]
MTGGFVLPANPAVAVLHEAARTDPDHAYTLPELVNLAHSANPRARAAWQDARSAAAGVDLARGTYGPRLAFTGAAGGIASSSSLTALGQRGDSESDGASAVATFSLEWLLYDFGERAALVNAARQQSMAANIAFTAAHQQITYQVALAYYDDVSARARSANADRAVALGLEIEAAAKARLQQGVGTAVEAAHAHQATAQLRLGAVEAHALVADSRLRLLTAIGLPPFARLRLADAPERKLTTDMADMAEQAVAYALSRRPDTLAALAARKASEEGVRAVRADFLPKVFAAGSATHVEGSRTISSWSGSGGETPSLALSGARNSAALLIGVRVPLLDGGMRAARLAQAQSRAEAAAARLEDTQDRAVLEIVMAQNGLRSALEANVAAAEAQAAAQTTLDAALAAFRSGAGAITAVHLAQQQRLAADNAAVAAHAAALRAAATLALVTGGLGEAPD